MKKILISLVLVFSLTFGLVGCVSVDSVLSAAVIMSASEQKALATSFPEASEYFGLISQKSAGIKGLYDSWKAASASAKPGIAGQIEAAVIDLVSNDTAVLNLVQVKNPTLVVAIESVLAAVEAGIVAVQNDVPAPSGNSVQLNVTAAQLKAAGAQVK